MGLKKGFFITFEGIEGSGKTTQIKLLYKYLKKKTKKIYLTREPGGTKISEKIRSLVIKDLSNNSNPLTELFLLFAARAEHFDLIKKKIKEKYIVLCDRYINSTIAYQHYKGKINLKLINLIQANVDKGQKPNLTFLLDINPKITKDRILNRKKIIDRFDSDSLKNMNLIRNSFLKISKKFKKRINVINGSNEKKIVHNKIKFITENYLKNA